MKILGYQPNQPLSRKINPALLRRNKHSDGEKTSTPLATSPGKGKVPGIKPLTYRVFQKENDRAEETDKSTGNCTGESANNFAHDCNGDINNCSARDCAMETNKVRE